MTADRLSLLMSEQDFQGRVIDYAHLHRWHVWHQRPAQVRNGRWASAGTGDPGLPDLVLARDGVVLLAELKRHGGRTSPGQRGWLQALGGHGRLWTPDQWDTIVGELR